MLLRYLLLIFILFGASAYANIQTYDINFKVINVNGVAPIDEARMHEGIDFFNNILEQRCGFRLSAQIETQNLRTSYDGAPVFRNESSWSVAQVAESQDYFFRFYQKDMFQLTTTHQLTQKKNEVSIFVVDNFDMCGFAFPDIQLTDATHLSKNTNPALNQQVMPWIHNRVIMGSVSTGPRDCNYSNRIVAHELAHIFIQDESPHTCWDEQHQSYRPCPPDNILTTRVLIYPEPGNRSRPPGYGGMEPSEPEVRPAVGTHMTERQCQSVRTTIEKLLN